jgi:hypothetical protein
MTELGLDHAHVALSEARETGIAIALIEALLNGTGAIDTRDFARPLE